MQAVDPVPIDDEIHSIGVVMPNVDALCPGRDKGK